MRLRLLTVAAALTALLLSTTAAAAASRDNAKLLFFEDSTPAGGQSSLVRDGAAGTISAHIKATHLERGHAYTYWWVVFNDPSECNGPDDQDPTDESLPAMCGENDIFTATGLNVDQINNVGIGVLGGNGEIANNGGRASFTGTLFEGSAAGQDVVIGPGGLFDLGSLLAPGGAMTAEVHIVIRDHGPALSGGELAAQLTTFTGNCLGLDPSGTYDCVDPQFAVHK